MRRLHCVESPEPYFEDFGRASLNHSTATVTLDPDFASLVDTSDYYVFIQAEDADPSLRVTSRNRDSFTVKADATTSSGAFSWRLVARRSDLRSYTRLERVTDPATAPPDTQAAQLTMATALTNPPTTLTPTRPTTRSPTSTAAEDPKQPTNNAPVPA